MKPTLYTKTAGLSSILLFSALIFWSACKKEMPLNNVPEENTSLPQVLEGVPGGQHVPNQILLKFKTGTEAGMKTAIFERLGAKVAEHIHTETMKNAGDQEGIYLLNLPVQAAQGILNAKDLAEVEYAEPNYIYTHSASSDDPYYTGGSLWGMYSGSSTPANTYGCGAANAWANNHTGSSDVIVAIIDEGYQYTHEDLSANAWQNPGETAGDGIDNDNNGYVDDVYGWDFDGNNNSIYDGTGDDHGTHVAGTIGAVGGNNTGVAGVNWSVKMIACKFLGSNGGTTANAVKAVDYVTALKNKGYNIVASNNSWGGGGFSLSLYNAIKNANSAGVLFIAAAGNNGTNNDRTASFPANYSISNKYQGKSYPGLSNMIVVAAIASNGTLASFSQYGAKSVHLGAPGVGIWSTLPFNTYGSYNGTSMATPHVSGAAALYKSVNTGAGASAIKSAILGSVTATSALSGKCSSGGRLNVSGF